MVSINVPNFCQNGAPYIKAYCVNVMVDIKPIYLNKRYLLQNKVYYLDITYFCFAKMKLLKVALYKLNQQPDQLKMQAISDITKKCGSFLKYVILVTSSTSKGVPLQCLQTAKLLVISCRRIRGTTLQQLLAKRSETAAVHYFQKQAPEVFCKKRCCS